YNSYTLLHSSPCTCLLFFFLPSRPPPRSTLFPYTTLFRSCRIALRAHDRFAADHSPTSLSPARLFLQIKHPVLDFVPFDALLLRSEEHTSELQSRSDLVCRLLLEKKKKKKNSMIVK